MSCLVSIIHIHLKGNVPLRYHTISFLWQIFFQIAESFMSLTNFSFCHCFNPTLTLMKLSRFSSRNASMYQRQIPQIPIPFVRPFMSFEHSTSHYSRHFRELCGFNKIISDTSKITRFKQDFLSELEDLFSHLVDLTEPICQVIDPSKANLTLFDSSCKKRRLPKVIQNTQTVS